MTLQAIYALLVEVISLVGTITGILGTLKNSLANVATESAPLAIETIASNGTNTVINPTYGNQALYNLITANQTALLTALGSPQQAGQPVTLPAVAPSGYGGPSAGDVTNAVWAYQDGSTVNCFTALYWAGQYAFAGALNQGIRVSGQPFLSLMISSPAEFQNYFLAQPQPPLDPSSILATDATPQAWVQRAYSGYSWAAWSGPDQTVYYADGYLSAASWVLTLSQPDFDALKAANAAAGVKAAPVWPGLANVTLGTAVPISPSTQTVEGPMDGVIVAITAVPTPVGYYQFGPDKSFVRVGGVTFQSDNGNDEEAQPIAFQSMIIVPKTMARAQRALFRSVSGLEGTITPWTIV